MKRSSLVLIAVVCGAGLLNAQDKSSGNDRGGTWVRGHWEGTHHHRHWVRGYWTAANQVRDEYNDLSVAEIRPVIGKFVDDHWSWQNARMVYCYKHFGAVDQWEESFSAAALNARLARPDLRDRVAQRGLGEM